MVHPILGDSVLLPALVGISSVLVFIAGLFWLQSSKLYHRNFSSGATHYEVSDSGAHVRRSNRYAAQLTTDVLWVTSSLPTAWSVDACRKTTRPIETHCLCSQYRLWLLPTLYALAML